MFDTIDDQIDDLLHRICVKLQISRSQHQLAEDRYKAVADWISKGDGLFEVLDLTIYPQGSINLGTTVKPIERQEFDLDLVCEFKIDWQKVSNPVTLLDVMEDRLKQNKWYSNMYERKNRCIRLNYSGDFHMDILPACPENLADADTKLKVPDRKNQDWKDSNPKGYGKWVEDRSAYTSFELLEKKAEIEPLPGHQPVELKPPLKRAIQLIKRNRDIVFNGDIDNAPISIVLTTLACENYSEEGSVNHALSSIFLKIADKIIQSNGQPFSVLNPTNRNENFSEKWDDNPKLYRRFVEFILTLRDKWAKVNQTQGIHNILPLLMEMFGENVASEALQEQTTFLEAYRKNERLGINRQSGIILPASSKNTVRMERNTFFGQEE